MKSETSFRKDRRLDHHHYHDYYYYFHSEVSTEPAETGERSPLMRVSSVKLTLTLVLQTLLRHNNLYTSTSTNSDYENRTQQRNLPRV